jgi:competence protein ComEA
VSQQSQSTPSSFEAPIRLHALRQMQEEVREQVRVEAWSAMRAQLRGAIAGLTLVSLAVGALIGYYGGGRQATRGSNLASVPAWECTPSSLGAYGTVLPAHPTPWPIRVYVSGAVVEPRVVALPPGSLIADALAAVGGASTDADLAALNLAASLRDHQHVQVPRLSSRLSPVATPLTLSETGGGPVQSHAHLVDINTAAASELEALPGIGPARAQEIIIFREAHGPFASTADIMQVPGIGPATYERMVLLITVGAEMQVEFDPVPFP